MSAVSVRTRHRPAADGLAPAPAPSLGWTNRLSVAVEYRPTGSLRPADRQTRKHSKKQIHQLAASIRAFGFVNPVLLDGDGRIVAGHGRIEAAKLIGMESVPTIRLDHLTEAQLRAYRIADNRLAECAEWDQELLALELGELLELELDFAIEITGFETAEIDLLLSDSAVEEPETEDPVPEPAAVAVSRVGDLWQLGPHRLLCGDARDPAIYDRLLAGTAAQMVFTDPPYNVPIQGHVSGLGKFQHREFAMAAGEMSRAEFTAFLQDVLGQLARVSADSSIHYVCMDWGHMGELLTAGEATYGELKNLCVWNKTNAGMGSFYRSKHELVFVFKQGSAPHINNFGLGDKGRYRTNVWDYAGANSFGRARDAELAMHPTIKPVALVMDAIKDCSHRNGIVLDPFGGSGTTLIAVERTGRRGYLLELDPLYVDVIVRRWQRLTGGLAGHEASGLSFDAVTAERAPANDPLPMEAGHVR